MHEHRPDDKSKQRRTAGVALAEAAAQYAARGWAIFPCKPGAKEPLTFDGFKSATTDAEQVATWWATWPDANIGLVPGRAGLIVLDLDGPEARTEAQVLGLLAEPTRTVVTPHGLHLYYKHPGGRIGNRKLAAHIDTRADEGYVLLPPSVHPSGGIYRGESRDVLELPPDARDALTNGGRSHAAPAVGDLILEGTRNTTLASIAGTMRRRNVSETGIVAALLAENAQRCRPPLDDAEVRAIASSVGRYDPAPVVATAARPTEPAAPRGPLVRTLQEMRANPAALRPPPPVIPRVAYAGRVVLLAAREKSGGKSTFTTAGCASVTRGADFLGERCQAGAVLWVTADWEHDADILQRAARFGADESRFHVLWPPTLAELEATIAQVEPCVVVIDTLSNFYRVREPGSSSEWPDVLMPLVRMARERDLAMVVNHHTKKGEGGGYRDSTQIGASVDLILEITADAGNPTRRNVTALGRWAASNFAIELVGDTYQLVAGGDLGLEAKVLAYITRHPACSSQAVRDGIGGRAKDTDAALARLATSGAIRDAGTSRHHAWEAGPAAPTLPLGGPDAPSF